MDARSGGESRCDSGEYRDEDVQDFTPKRFVFHDVCCVLINTIVCHSTHILSFRAKRRI